eukprot:scaffold239057_cov32-Tisochrysis_lutea.AAC.3
MSAESDTNFIEVNGHERGFEDSNEWLDSRIMRHCRRSPRDGMAVGPPKALDLALFPIPTLVGSPCYY